MQTEIKRIYKYLYHANHFVNYDRNLTFIFMNF